MPEQLIEALYDIERTYRSLKTDEDSKMFFMNVRERYNGKNLNAVENTNCSFSSIGLALMDYTG